MMHRRIGNMLETAFGLAHIAGHVLRRRGLLPWGRYSR
jgi:hypothetical protein